MGRGWWGGEVGRGWGRVRWEGGGGGVRWKWVQEQMRLGYAKGAGEGGSDRIAGGA